MFSIILTLHLVSIAVALGGRIIFAFMLYATFRKGVNERLDELQTVLLISRLADIGLVIVILTGIALYSTYTPPISNLHWAFKLKLATISLVIIDIGALHIAQTRVVNHYDVQMIPNIKRLNLLSVALLFLMVFFATFSM